MPIRLPKIEETSCILFIACAKVEPDSPHINKLLSKRSEYFHRKRIGDRQFLIAMKIGGDDDELNHLHVDFASLADLSLKDAPKTTHSVKAIQEALEPFIGQKAEVRTEGNFHVPLSDLPDSMREYLKIMATPTVIGGVKVRQTSGTLTVEGGPVHLIQWRLRRDGEAVLLEMEGRRKLTITESYFEELWRSTEATFKSLVEQESSNAQD